MSNLIEYGVQNEESTHRIHFDISCNSLVVYETYAGARALPEPVQVNNTDDWEVNGYYLVYPRYTHGIPTSRGIRIPYWEIGGSKVVDIPEWVVADLNTPTTNSDPSEKGKYAQVVVDRMMSEGYIPFKFKTHEIIDKNMQIKGIDLESNQLKIQIKFDYGCIERGLFLQTHESNPNKFY